MVTVKLLKPYYIKTDDEVVRVILAYQYFTMLINNKVYQFVPIDAKEVHVNRQTQKVENIDAVFAFQKGNEVIHIEMKELIMLPDFLDQILLIVKPYFYQRQTVDTDQAIAEDSEKMVQELEDMNIKRLIDKALDEKDENTFNQLTTLLR